MYPKNGKIRYLDSIWRECMPKIVWDNDRWSYWIPMTNITENECQVINVSISDDYTITVKVNRKKISNYTELKSEISHIEDDPGENWKKFVQVVTGTLSSILLKFKEQLNQLGVKFTFRTQWKSDLLGTASKLRNVLFEVFVTLEIYPLVLSWNIQNNNTNSISGIYCNVLRKITVLLVNSLMKYDYFKLSSK